MKGMWNVAVTHHPLVPNGEPKQKPEQKHTIHK